MWLLNTANAELHHFASPDEVPDGYAILSHAWGEDEQTFQDLKRISKRCKLSAEALKKTESPRKDTSLPDHAPSESIPDTRRSSFFDFIRFPASTKRKEVPDSADDAPEEGGATKKPRLEDDDLSAAAALALAVTYDPTHPHCADLSTNPRDLVGRKLQQFCIVAEQHGYRWAWADTCCIDKTSSAELEEAINSMWTYYALAEVCYVYLADVPSKPSLALNNSEGPFARSRWHKRGWTLQELIAPRTLVFMSCDWERLGTKAELADCLAQITHVPASVLTFRKALADVSVAQRMSWAADRKTTRLEDEAYCLMGIFNINMPTLYGEGGKAFYRLQEEIMRTYIDTSILAWGEPSKVDVKAPASRAKPAHDCTAEGHHLLASSPRAFKDCSRVTFDSKSKVSTVRLPHSSVLTQHF